MTKRDIIETLGEGFNYYPDDVWIYEVKNMVGKENGSLSMFQ